MREAVNYAIDRTALARLGDEYDPLPEHPTDHYLPPGIPGYRNLRIYPLTPDRSKARKLAAGHMGGTAVFYGCQLPPCAQQAQVIKTKPGGDRHQGGRQDVPRRHPRGQGP
jgi:hypothetical protein